MRIIVIFLCLTLACSAQTRRQGEIVKDDSTGSYLWYELNPDTVLYIANFVRGGRTIALSIEQYCTWLEDSNDAIVAEREMMNDELKRIQDQLQNIKKDLRLLDKQEQFLRQTKRILRNEFGVKCKNNVGGKRK